MPGLNQVIRTVPEEMRRCANDITAKIEEMRTEQETMTQKIEELMSSWTGKEAQSFKAQYDDFTARQKEFLTKMEQYPSEISKEADLREAADEQKASSLSS